MKARVTLTLDRVQVERLRAMAERRGRPLSALVREILAEHLDLAAAKKPGRALLDRIDGIGRLGGLDHDEALYGKRKR